MTTENDAQTPNANDGNEQEPEHIRTLREKAKEADQLRSQLAELNRREAFRDAGINPGDSKMSYFIKGYEGELTPDAIRAKAIEDGFLADAEAEARNAELEGHERMDATAAGTQTQTPKGDEQVIAALANAKDPTEVMRIVAEHNPAMIAPIE